MFPALCEDKKLAIMKMDEDFLQVEEFQRFVPFYQNGNGEFHLFLTNFAFYLADQNQPSRYIFFSIRYIRRLES